MTHRYIKIAATSVVLVAAFSALLYSTLREGTEYFKNIDEVMTNRQAWVGKPLQLHGYVVPGSIYRKRDSLEYRFKVQNNPARNADAVTGGVVEASYTGIVPDTFKDGSEVVVKGRLGPDGFAVEPGGVMAKCPSRYEGAQKTGQSAGR
jgi:cytochrome c-type biogenesis protein CcmE